MDDDGRRVPEVNHLKEGEHMLRRVGIAIIALVVLGVGCAPSTYFVSTWTDPSITGPINLTDKKVAAFLITDRESTRRPVEDIFAGEITASGAQGVPGYTLIPSGQALDREWVEEQLRAEDIEAAVVVRVIGLDTETYYVPGATTTYPSHYSSFYGYWEPGWTVVQEPGYMETDLIVSIETLVYSVTEDKLLWSGVSETINPSQAQSLAIELAAVAAGEMKKSGLLEDTE